MKRIIVVIITGILTMVLLTGSLFAQQRQITPKTRIDPRLQTKKLQLLLRTDLRVDVIHSSRCKCDLDDVNAFYMANIMVDVSNHKAGNAGVATESVLTVTYYDMNQGKMVTITKNLAKMNPYPTNPWTMQRYVVVNTPVLVKKSIGIKATIKPKASNISDPVPANNTKIIKKCQVMVY